MLQEYFGVRVIRVLRTEHLFLPALQLTLSTVVHNSEMCNPTVFWHFPSEIGYLPKEFGCDNLINSTRQQVKLVLGGEYLDITAVKTAMMKKIISGDFYNITMEVIGDYRNVKITGMCAI